jgi:hypothetical protein
MGWDEGARSLFLGVTVRGRVAKRIGRSWVQDAVLAIITNTFASTVAAKSRHDSRWNGRTICRAASPRKPFRGFREVSPNR